MTARSSRQQRKRPLSSCKGKGGGTGQACHHCHPNGGWQSHQPRQGKGGQNAFALSGVIAAVDAPYQRFAGLLPPLDGLRACEFPLEVACRVFVAGED